MVDTIKNDSAHPDYRARFVGQELNTGIDPTLCTSTPPLEALKLLLDYAAGNTNVNIMLSDVQRAYFNGLAQRELYVNLAKEDPDYQPWWVGRLRLALYGKGRSAWQNTS